MPEPTIERDEIRRQAEKHLHSLREAGIEWLPKGEPLSFAARMKDSCTDPVPCPITGARPMMATEVIQKSTRCPAEVTA